MRPRLVAVNVVHTVRPGASGDTAIDKRPVPGRIAVGPEGVDGDVQSNRRHHGGRDKALHAYAVEDAAWWAERLGRDMPPGVVGENLSTAGVNVCGALIGERWWIGPRATGCLVEVTMPRTPCPNLSFRMGIKHFHRDFARANRTGAYLRVLTRGRVAAGSQVVVDHRPEHGVTVADVAGRAADVDWAGLLGAGLDLAGPVRRLAERESRRLR